MVAPHKTTLARRVTRVAALSCAAAVAAGAFVAYGPQGATTERAWACAGTASPVLACTIPPAPVSVQLVMTNYRSQPVCVSTWGVERNVNPQRRLYGPSISVTPGTTIWWTAYEGTCAKKGRSVRVENVGFGADKKFWIDIR